MYLQGDYKLGQGIVAIITVICSCQYCQTQLSITWDIDNKDACIKMIYARIINYNSSKILVSQNNWNIMDFIYDGKYYVEYEKINKIILE